MESDFLVFPFWDDTNTDNPYDQGRVSYEVHTTETEASLGYLGQVSTFVEQAQEVEFTGLWMLLVEWSGVPSQQLLEELFGVGNEVGEHAYPKVCDLLIVSWG